MGFLAPLFLAGLAAVAVPIVLHLFRREIAPPVPFTAVRFLQRRTIERQERRRIQDPWLLLLRAAALALLAFAFARPYLKGATTSEPPVVIAVDVSYSMGAPGRLDLIGATEDGAPAYVDYAHKPDALENVLSSVRPFTTGRVIVVFGCGGDRDRGKRPIMGEIATRLADVVIVTDDNPRSEVPETIRAEILTAAPGAIEIGDRRSAIKEAVRMLKAGDTLIVAGKGHEEGQTVGTVVLPFSDHVEVAQALRERLL